MSDEPLENGPVTFKRGPSRPIAKIAAALSAAQAEFEDIKKECTVDFTDRNGRRVKYNYASLASVYKATRKALSKNGLALTACLEGDELVCRLIHSSGEFFSSTVHLGQAKDWKTFGGDITYATRYAVSGLLGVASEEDADAPADERPKRGQRPRQEQQQQGNQGNNQGQQRQRQQQQNRPEPGTPEHKYQSALKSANTLKTPEKLTDMAKRYANRSDEEKSAIIRSGKERGWVWNKDAGKFVAPEREPGDEPPPDDNFNPTDEQGGNVF